MKTNRLPQWMLCGAVALCFFAAAMQIVTAKAPKNKTAKDVSTSTGAKTAKAGQETATIAGGCFWSMEAMFKQLKGVASVEPGYAGGTAKNPTYETVETGTTGHAESINIIYDPKVISYRELLNIFFTVHDPTTLNRQGGDEGTQYRSMILFRNAEQEKAAREVMAQFTKDKTYADPIVTQIVPLKNFVRAEDYHLDYYNLNPNQPYCRAVVAPKIEKLHHKFADKLK